MISAMPATNLRKIESPISFLFQIIVFDKISSSFVVPWCKETVLLVRSEPHYELEERFLLIVY